MFDVVDPRASGPVNALKKFAGQSEREVDRSHPRAFLSKGIFELDERREDKDFANL